MPTGNPYLDAGVAIAQILKPDPGIQGMAASQPGVVAAQQFGIFGDASQAGLASMTASTFQATSPSGLAALNLDELVGVGEGFAVRLADSVILPITSSLRPIPSTWLLIGGALLLFFLFRKKGH